MKCLLCNHAEMFCERKKYHYKESGLDNVYLEGIEVCRCPSCGEEIVNIPAVPELNSTLGKYLIKKKSLLNGQEIRFLRKNAGMSAKKLSEIIGVDKSTVSRWENSTQALADSNDRLIRLVYSEMKGVPKEEINRLIEDFKDIGSVQELIPFNIPIQEWYKNPMCSITDRK